MTVSLHEIEQQLTQLWSNPENLEKLRNQQNIDGIAPEVQAQLRVPAVLIYQNSVWGKRFQYTRAVYPTTRRILADRWVEVVEQFWLNNKNESSNQWIVLNAFPNFLVQNCSSILKDIPFLADIAEFERDRAVVYRNNQMIHATKFNPAQIVRHQATIAPTVNETLLVRTYAFPVVQITKKINAQRKDQPVHLYDETAATLAIYQDPQTREIRVQRLGQAAAAIVVTAKSEPISYKALAEATLKRLGETQSSELHKLVFETFAQLHTIGIFSGFEELSGDKANDVFLIV
jgi:hypothetical protein